MKKEDDFKKVDRVQAFPKCIFLVDFNHFVFFDFFFSKLF